MSLDLTKYLEEIEVQLDQLLLDPNNPRFATLASAEANQVLEANFADETVQRTAFQRMLEDEYEVRKLADTIRILGFLPMDRIVVRSWRGGAVGGDQRYVVLEGNRRVTALKMLIQAQTEGLVNYTQDQISNFTTLSVLKLADGVSPAIAELLLPGSRHISGIKPWAPYQQGKMIASLREREGLSAQEAADSLGIKKDLANKLWRSFHALRQMENDNQYQDVAHTKLYSFFEEAMKRPRLRDVWLSWSDDEKGFTNLEHLREFYSWIVGTEDEESGELVKKLPTALDVRSLASIVDNDDKLNEFRHSNRPIGDIARPDPTDEDWLPIVQNARRAIAHIPADELSRLPNDSQQKLVELSNVVSRVLGYIEKLKDNVNE